VSGRPIEERPLDPDPLTLVEDQERPLIWIGGERLDRRAYHIGRADGAASRPIWRRIVALMVATFLAGVLIGRLIVPVQAASRSGQTTERFDLSPLSSAALSGAPLEREGGWRPDPIAGDGFAA
jgi:hypothetical protein